MKRYLYLFIISVFAFLVTLSGVLGNLIQSASASPSISISLNWVNECTITGSITDTENGNTKTTNLSFDDLSQGCIQNWDQNGNPSGTYQFIDQNTCQESNIHAGPYTSQAGKPIVQGYIYYTAPGVSGACQEDNLSSSNSFVIGDTGNADIVYVLDGSTITRVDNDSSYTFTQSSTNSDIYVMNSGGTCPDRIVVGGYNPSSGTLYEVTDPSSSGDATNPTNTPAPAASQATGCYISYDDDDINGPETAGDSGLITLDNVCETGGDSTASYCSDHPQGSDGGFSLHLGSSSNQSPGGTGGSATSNLPSCESTGGPLSWFTCEIIDGISTLENSLESLVQNLLKTPPIDLNSSDCQSGHTSQNYTSCLVNVWSSFRVFGDVVLVIILLIAIIAEAAGGGVSEAYTVRRILPRLLLVAILINISIYIMAGMVDITNIVGQGIFNFITIPFKETNTYHINISGTGGNLFGTGSLLAIIGAGGGIWALVSHGGLGDAVGFLALFVGLPALLAILGVVLTIFFRTVLLILLLMVSPVAFALYCLPNTEQYFKKWWDLLFKTLMVYPIVMVIFAMCDLGAVVISSFVPGGEQWIGDLFAIVGVSAPLFLVPFAFKFSGGVIGSIHGAVTNVGQRTTEAIKGNPNDPNSMRNRTKRRFGVRTSAAGLSWGAIGTRLNPKRVTRTGRENYNARMSAHRQAGLEQLRRQEEETGIFRASQGDSGIMRQLAWYEDGKAARAANTADLKKDNSEIAQQLKDNKINPEQANAARVTAEREYTQRNAAIAVAERIGYNPATRRAALLNQYQVGFEMPAGEEGWDKASKIADSIAGNDPFQYRSIMDEYQAVAKGPAGRVDQAGNTNGDRTYNGNKAWNSGSLYEIGSGKPSAIKGSADYYSGVLDRINRNALDARDSDFATEAAERGIEPRAVAAEAVGAFYAEQSQLAQNAKGGARDAAMTARRRLGDAIDGSTYMRDMVNNDPNAARIQAVAQARAGNTPVRVADVVSLTGAVSTRARTYETPDRIAQQGGAP